MGLMPSYPDPAAFESYKALDAGSDISKFDFIAGHASERFRETANAQRHILHIRRRSQGISSGASGRDPTNRSTSLLRPFF